MSIASILYKLILGPLVLLFDVIYAVAYHAIGNPGLSIIFLSLAMNLLVLPLYRRADAMQEEERQISQKLQPGIDHIKKVFKGDERFMMLQTYYRQNNYKPYYALKGSLSLLLEIPFFIAAYRFLSGLQLLRGVAFGPIQNLGLPDGLISIGGHTLNLLPILMTLINIISGAIYTKGMPLKSKLQLYGMALIFLFFLYDSPSGLVFYWTLNNVFSLVKNLFYKLRRPRLVISALCAALGLSLLAVLLFVHPMETLPEQLILIAVAIALLAPLAKYLLRRGRPAKPAAAGGDSKSYRAVFYLCCVVLTVLTGVLIPSAVIRSSPAEFVNLSRFQSPIRYVVNAALLAAGTFLIWCNIFYRLASPSGRRGFSFAALAVVGAGVVDFMFYGTKYGNMSSSLQYDAMLSISGSDYLINTAVVLALVALLYCLWRWKPALIQAVSAAAVVAVVVLSAGNVSAVNTSIGALAESIDLEAVQQRATIPLDKSGRNVMVIMLDRAMNRFFPFLLEEKPELKEQFAGFTYYPNTISYGPFTNVASPALYGGYEYTPENINSRQDVPLVEEQDQALKVMPVNFLNAGYEVTVCDPTYAGYSWIPDLGIYDEYPEIHRYITNGNFNADEYSSTKRAEAIWERNFFCYSVFRMSPLLFQTTLYDNGMYNESDALPAPSTEGIDQEIIDSTLQYRDSMHTAVGLGDLFMNAYSVLTNLPGITEVRDEGKDTFLMISNDTTHEPMLLQEPDFVPAYIVDNTEYDAEHAVRYDGQGGELSFDEGEDEQQIHYHANMAALLQLGNWFDEMRAAGVYDNTRIIVVADHSRHLRIFDDMIIGESDAEDLLVYNPLLLVKDFNSRKFTVDDSFMTNGDTPTLAFQGLIDNPVNPITGNPITDEQKSDPVQHVVFTVNFSPETNNGNVFADLTWLECRDSMDRSAWRVLGDGVLPPEGD